MTADSLAERAEVEEVAVLLGREPKAPFTVVLRDAGGRPVVIRNDPLCRDGTPMPTLYWLVGDEAVAVSRLEAAGGVRAASSEVDPEELSESHRSYAEQRDAALPPAWEGPRPTGGVGGARKGVKCLHAHYAWYLVGGDDPVGRWVESRLRALGPGEALSAQHGSAKR